MIPDSTLAQIQERIDIVDVVSGYLPLKRAGRNFKANCPFHNEKTPSFMVNPDKQIFHCFGCGAGGNVFGFVMKIERKDFPETVEMLAERAGVEIPKDRPVDNEAAKRSALFIRANESAATFYHKTLKEDPQAETARDYMRRRGVLEKTLEQFRIGWAPDAWDGFYRTVKGQVPDAVLEKAGLVIARKDASGFYDRFRARVMFPILDIKGVCVALGGRVLDDSVPKYLNSPETDIYSKGRHLYGLFQARRSIRDLDQAIVVEGYMDLVVCHQAGVENVVASLGTALTGEQVRLLKRQTRNIVMLYDSDKAGEAATLRGLELFLEEGMDVKIVRLLEGHDPDSFIREFGVEKFRRSLADALTLFDYKLSLLKAQFPAQTLENKVKIAGQMVSLFAKVQNEILRAAWMKELSRELSLPEDALAAEMRKSKREAEVKAPAPAARQAAPPSSPLLERMLLGLMLDSRDFVEQARPVLAANDFQNPSIRRVVKQLLESEPSDATASQWINFFKEEPETVEAIVSAVAEVDKTEKLDDKRKSFRDCLHRVRLLKIEHEIEDLKSRLAIAQQQGDRRTQDQLVYDMHQLSLKKRAEMKGQTNP